MALREILARFGFQIDHKGLKKAETGITGVISKLQTFGIALGGAVVARGVKDFISSTVAIGDNIGKTAVRLGGGTTELQRWQIAAEASGVSSEEFTIALKSLQKNASNAAAGEKGLAKAFDDLGVTLVDSEGKLKSGTVLMREVGLALNDLETDTEKVAISQRFMEESGFKLLSMFEGEAEGLDELLGILDKVGGGMSENAIKQAEKASMAFLFWDASLLSVKSAIAVHVLPAISYLAVKMSSVIGAVAKFLESSGAVHSMLVALGLVLGKLAFAKFAGSLLKLGRAAMIPLAKFILLFLVVDDLIALFSGRGSIIGVFIDKIFGPGSAAAVVNAIRGIGSAVANVVKTGDFKKLDEDLDAIFGPVGHDIVADIVFTFGMILEALDALILELGEGLELIISDLEAWGNELQQAFEAELMGIANDAIDLGKAIVDGIVEGIKDGAFNVSNALLGVVGGGLKTARKGLKVHSPSKVAEKQVGEPLVQGLFPVTRALLEAKRFAAVTASGIPQAVSASARGNTAPAIARGGVVFRSEINLTVSGGSASDPQIQKLR